MLSLLQVVTVGMEALRGTYLADFCQGKEFFHASVCSNWLKMFNYKLVNGPLQTHKNVAFVPGLSLSDSHSEYHQESKIVLVYFY